MQVLNRLIGQYENLSFEPTPKALVLITAVALSILTVVCCVICGVKHCYKPKNGTEDQQDKNMNNLGKKEILKNEIGLNIDPKVTKPLDKPFEGSSDSSNTLPIHPILSDEISKKEKNESIVIQEKTESLNVVKSDEIITLTTTTLEKKSEDIPYAFTTKVVLVNENNEKKELDIEIVDTNQNYGSYQKYALKSKVDGEFIGLGSIELCVVSKDAQGNNEKISYVHINRMSSDTRNGTIKYIGSALHEFAVYKMIEAGCEEIILDVAYGSGFFHYKCGFRYEDNAKTKVYFFGSYMDDIADYWDAKKNHQNTESMLKEIKDSREFKCIKQNAEMSLKRSDLTDEEIMKHGIYVSKNDIFERALKNIEQYDYFKKEKNGFRDHEMAFGGTMRMNQETIEKWKKVLSSKGN